MYKLFKDLTGTENVGVILNGKIAIPFSQNNTDYQTFKKEVLAGAELQDADGNVMTQEQANQFVASLP
jgi:hypothetical protein